MLLNKIRSLPNSPGVYQYFDKDGKLLYIGKAKNLQKRVKSYFKLNPLSPSPRLSPRIYKMISQTTDLDYIVVKSEQDALILENSLIKQLKPKYNILLRDDKTYPYIYINFDEDFPRPKITRKVVKGNVKYFGPFPSAANDILDSLYEIFPLVQKESCIKGKKACLFYQIKRCLAPCEGKISKKEYQEIIKNVINTIHNKTLLINLLKKKMEKLSNELRFEEAAIIRDRIKNISSAQIQSHIDLASKSNIDIFVIKSVENEAVVVRMFLRDGKVIASSSNKINFEQDFDEDEAYKRALLEFYTQDTPFTSNTILVAKEFAQKDELSLLISEKIGKKVSIEVPKRGKKRELIELALLNADELLKKKNPNKDLLKELKEILNLTQIPYKIEIFDNSHLRGFDPVGAMVVYENGEFNKKLYRHYKLDSQDEYAQMRELLTKRVQSFEKNPPPNMWLIDGGETLRTLAKDILKSVGVDGVDVVAISKEKRDKKTKRAKGGTKDIVYCDNKLLRLSPTDSRLLLLQKLRDEAHRFAITFHKKQRLKRAKEIELLKIKGIGEAKVKKLLNYFGSFENIKNASLEELQNVMSKKDAQNLFNFYK